MTFTNKACPYCKKEFIEGDKFCSSCGRPIETTKESDLLNKKDCTANQETTQCSTLSQPQTQTENSEEKVSQSKKKEVDRDLYEFIGHNQRSYILAFERMEKSNTKLTWNWASFFFGEYWYVYRKMYGMSIIFYLLSIVCSLIPVFGPLLLRICSGILGNQFYKQYISNEFRIVKNIDGVNKTAYISKKGGTSIGAVIVFMGVVLVINWAMVTVINSMVMFLN